MGAVMRATVIASAAKQSTTIHGGKSVDCFVEGSSQ